MYMYTATTEYVSWLAAKIDGYTCAGRCVRRQANKYNILIFKTFCFDSPVLSSVCTLYCAYYNVIIRLRTTWCKLQANKLTTMQYVALWRCIFDIAKLT